MCGHHHETKGLHDCNCPGPRMERFIQPCLLLLLCEKESHGYELMENLGQFGFEGGIDPGAVYRNLRKLEEDGLVDSSWETEGPGPAKRQYRITEAGIEGLHGWAVNIRAIIKRLQGFLKRYEDNFSK